MQEKQINNCPEFPFFGATYPDATCIDGYLWDLDKCDENGLYGSGDNPPCPFCKQEEFLENHQHDEGYDREQMIQWIDKIKTLYS